MNFGAFLGNFGSGFAQGVKTGKSISDMIKEGKLQDMREKGLAEASAQREQQINDLIKSKGESQVLPEQPTSGPVDTATPKVETPADAQAVSESSPTASPDAAQAKGAASAMAPQQVTAPAEAPTANPDAAAAATAAGNMPKGSQLPLAPSVSTQAPAPVQATPDTKADATPTPQQATAATGVTGNIPGQAGFWVNGQRYDTRDQARAAAEKAVPTSTEMFLKTTGPKIAEQYIANGEPEKALAWNKWTEESENKRAMKQWASAFTAPDFDTAAARFGKYYSDHINDGVDYTGHKMKVNADGTQVAVVTLKDKATGKETEMEMTREKMLALGAANNPQKLFEMEQAKQSAAEKLKFEYQIKQQGRRADMEDKKELERYKADVNSDRESNKVNAKIDAQVSSLRDAGYSDAEIKKMMPAIVGAGEHKKTTDPAERRALIASDLLKNDPTFARKSKDEQNKRIDDMMGVIYGDQKAEPAPAKAPVILDKGMPYDKNLPVKYRKSDGKAFHVNAKGEYVPIEGAVPANPAAGGLPK